MTEYYRIGEPPPLVDVRGRTSWFWNGLGWVLFVVGPGCGVAVGLAVGKLVWG